MCINKPRMKATDNVALEFSQGFSMTGWAWFFFFLLIVHMLFLLKLSIVPITNRLLVADKSSHDCRGKE